ncbi:DUF6779 domain-containing protein [Corynebacterium freiburgense]|uniref:DUF6779 domain-containing protein n=1 Tax=Corynebacterium freiburgense TaxID=556548 RepID=UPI00041FD7DC|nr:DUF6779 domain-containing protein [Corynebacterium freiburgense]WJZ03685.1 hypothetical protein CFREI_12140 [Corynebacterium freiburgense]
MSTRDVPGTKPKRGIDLGQILMGVMVALALLAGVIGLFSGSSLALKLAMLIALWACVVAAFLVANKRKQYDEELLKKQRSLDADRLRAQQDYQRQLNEQREETLESIRGQLDAMRNQLEELSGVMLAYEPAALKAEARRIPAIELDSSKGGASFSKETEALIPVVPEPVEVDVEDSFISEPLAKKPDYVAKPFAKPTAGPSAATGATAAPRFNSGAFSSTRWDAGGIEKNPPVSESRHTTDNPFRAEPTPQPSRSQQSPQRAGTRPQQQQPQRSQRVAANQQSGSTRSRATRPQAPTPSEPREQLGSSFNPNASPNFAADPANSPQKNDFAAANTSAGFGTGQFKAQPQAGAGHQDDQFGGRSQAATPEPQGDDSLLRSRFRSSTWQEPEKAAARPAPATPKPQPKPKPKPQPKPEPLRPAAHRPAAESPKRPAPEPVSQPVSHAAEPRGRGGRRRRDEHQQGVSVADLLKNLKQ